MADFKSKADAKIAKLAAKQEEWGATAPSEKVALIGALLQAQKDAFELVAKTSDESCVSVGFDSADDPAATPHWCLESITNALFFAGFLPKMKATLEQYAKDGTCPKPLELKQAKDGRWVASIHPMDNADKFGPQKDWQAHLWLQEGKEPTQGAAFKENPRPNSCGLVLGAGNVGALAVVDVLHLLFQCNTVVLLKIHVLRVYQEEFLKALFKPAIDKGFVDVIVEESGLGDAVYLVNHPSICHIHMTGATATHDAIVWGPPAEQEMRKKSNQPVLDLSKVKMTSELGCITPYMLCPAVYTPKELTHHARHLATLITSNNSYYCNSPKVLIVAEEWAQKDEFVEKMRAILKYMKNPPPYYPGSHKRYEGLMSSYSAGQVTKIEGPNCSDPSKFGTRIPWTLISTSVDAKNLAASAKEPAFQTEPFCPVLTVCTMKGTTGPKEYLEAATTLANDYIWGTLSCTLLVHPSIEKEVPDAVESAIASLKYGSIMVNCWSGSSYSFWNGYWGGYAGADSVEQIDAVQSGLGCVANCLQFDHPSKVVVRSPFTDPMHMGAGEVMTKKKAVALTNFVVNPGCMTFLKMVAPGIFDTGCLTGLRSRRARKS